MTGRTIVIAIVLAASSGCVDETHAPGDLAPGPAPGEKLDTPALTRPVTDLAGILSPGEVEGLASRLLTLREETGAQLAVLIVTSTGVEPIEDFSMRTATAWRGGAVGRDDGLLLTLAMRDRKVRLEVGYGMEEHIPDGAAGAITDGMRDALRDGRTADAIDGAISAVGRRLPRLDPSFLDGGYWSADRHTAGAAALVVALAALTAIVFLFAPFRRRGTAPRPVQKSGWRKPPPLSSAAVPPGSCSASPSR
jgi:uncharacterized membrane protein YgcG